MPNHCYCTITLHQEKDWKILKKIVEEDKGLAEYLIPLPKALNSTTAPTRICSPQAYKDNEKKREKGKNHFGQEITKEMQQEFIDKYKFDNWYDWSIHNWGTKWGCYDNEMDDETYSFTTAWSPLKEELIEKFAQLVSGFSYFFEEETGWGGWREYEDGVCVDQCDYDAPNWTTCKDFVINEQGVIKELPQDHSYQDSIYEDWDYLCDVVYLDEDDYTNEGGIHKRGWYDGFNLEEFRGERLI